MNAWPDSDIRTATVHEDGQRLDVALAAETDLTRSRVGQLIRDGHARVDGETARKPGMALRAGQTLALYVPPPAPLTLMPENLPLAILYEDADIAVVDKPCGMVVHPAAGNETGTLVHALLYHLRGLSGIGGAVRPGIVHRLDKDTSGVLLIAKNDRAHLALSEAFQARTLQKRYLAIAYGTVKDEEGLIDAPIARHPVDRKRMAVVPGGKQARTAYRVLAHNAGCSLLLVDLLTGRTHQIRVHLAHRGHPLLGDPIYGGKPAMGKAARLMLHAAQLTFVHPVSGERMTFTAPVPDDFAQSARKLGFTASDWQTAQEDVR